jgi:hypothetical protein
LNHGDALEAPGLILAIEDLPIAVAELRDRTIDICPDAGHVDVLLLHLLPKVGAVALVGHVRQDDVPALEPGVTVELLVQSPKLRMWAIGIGSAP